MDDVELVEQVEPRPDDELGVGQLAQGEEVVGARPHRRGRLAAGLEPAGRVVADERRQLGLADLGAARVVGAGRGLGRSGWAEPGSARRRRAARGCWRRPARAVRGHATGRAPRRPDVACPERHPEHRGPPVEAAVVGLELLVAPVDRRPTASRRVGPIEEAVRRQETEERRRELEGEREAVETGDEAGDRAACPGGVRPRRRPAGTIDEEPDGGAGSDRGPGHRPGPAQPGRRSRSP